MKRQIQRMLAKKKIVLIFSLAILLPALVVGTMSLEAFSKRREAVRRLLESNLWISGESTLSSVEEALLEYEENALQPEKFAPFAARQRSSQPEPQPPIPASGIPGRPFLLDSDFDIVFPITASEKLSISSTEETDQDNDFSRAILNAENYEFSQKNFSRAAGAYRQCLSMASMPREKAMALEGLGRSLLTLGDVEGAYDVYSELSGEFGQIQDAAGHFYGVKAAFQIYEIEKLRKRKENGLDILLDLYLKIKAGEWPISLSSYDFFTSEVESLLEADLNEDGFPERRESFRALNESCSPYLEALLYTEFLRKDVVPKVEERLNVSSIGGGSQWRPDRLLSRKGEGFCLVSFTPLPDLNGLGPVYGGYCWDLDTLRTEILPEILEDLSKETELRIENIDELLVGESTGLEEASVNDSLLLSYRRFPLPWKLRVTQPALDDLEQTAKRENFLYGALLAFIVVLMILGAFLLGRDISREAETTRLKTEFVHNISHELKTPLTLIRLYGETLQRKENLSDEEKKESYEIITKESERLSHLINNVLDFSRIDMGRKEFSFSKGSLSRIIQETLDSYRYHLEKKGIVLKDEIARDLPEMTFDEEAVASVLVNLLSNAMKFSPQEKDVTVRLFRKDNRAVLQVEDRGIGISSGDLAGIFEKFYRAKNNVVSETRGSGLGLTLVKHIAEAHGGMVEVESEPGKGSVFSVILPIPEPEEG